MGQPSGSRTPPITPAAPAAPAAPTATEIVTRPDPGLARGKWEAPQWVFYVILAVVVLGATAYVLRRLGVLKIKKASPPSDIPPTSSRSGAPSRGGGPPSSRMRRQ